MAIKPDIATREDILTFVIEFYDLVKTDPIIGRIFTDIIKIDWDHHIPLITDFWETILLDNPVYRKNAMEKHFDINRIVPLTPAHFDAWLSSFNATIDQLFEGPVANKAKTRARAIAEIMQLKMDKANESLI